jgi:hypothetical protein
MQWIQTANRRPSANGSEADDDPPRGYTWVFIAIHGEKAAVRPVTEYVRHDS